VEWDCEEAWDEALEWAEGGRAAMVEVKGDERRCLICPD